MYYHIDITLHKQDEDKSDIVYSEWDIVDFSEVENRILLPYFQNEEFYFDGYSLKKKDIKRIIIWKSENNKNEMTESYTIDLGFNDSGGLTTSYVNYNKYMTDITSDVLTKIKNKIVTLPKIEDTLVNGLEQIIKSFHAVVSQLKNRYNNRNTLLVDDEYDVQDLFHALLHIYFDDIRKEEWVPSYAGSASRTDFLLPEIETVIEIKKTRDSMTTKQLGEQLIIDIQKYSKHPQCKKLTCFVYDPDNKVNNPRGIESDLNNRSYDIDVKVIIVPRYK